MRDFLGRAAPELKRQVDQAVALIWHAEQMDAAEGLTLTQIVETIHDAGLSRPNPTRLKRALGADKRVVRWHEGYRINANYKSEISEKLQQYADPIPPQPVGDLLPRGQYESGRKYLVCIADEANVAFEHQLYNSAAVMLRRVTESLLIDAYVNAKRVNEAQSGGSFLALDALINKFCGQDGFPVSRDLKKDLQAIKRIGDLAAHDRTYTVSRSDLWEMRIQIRRAVQELLHHAGYVDETPI